MKKSVFCLSSNIAAFCFLLIAAVLLLSACTQANRKEVDRLNDFSYYYHYRNLDSTELYARQALAQSKGYDDGEAEAYNNLAFANICRMNYQLAMRQLDSVNVTDNQIELLIADVLKMRLCQRESKNKDFYTYNERAMRRLKRIDEERSSLDDRDQKRMIYARSEYAITSSAYYYYVGLERQSAAAISEIDEGGEIQKDTAQYLNYLYNVGSGGVITVGSQDSIFQAEMNYLIRCYYLADYSGYPYWRANALQAMSEHLLQEHYGPLLLQNNRVAISAFNVDHMPDSLVAGNFAQRAMELFNLFGDTYQTAGAYRTLAECYERIGDFHSSLICLNDALKTKGIDQAPELVASIREQLSVAYSAVNDKPNSDYNRNLYLDLQEETRQDRYLESRAEQLSTSVMQLNLMIGAVIVLICLICFSLYVLNHISAKNERDDRLGKLRQPLEHWLTAFKSEQGELQERQENLSEHRAIAMVEMERNKVVNAEQRAKIFTAMSLLPFIDRMIHEISRLQKGDESEDARAERLEYIKEITHQIGDYNIMLTQWIQLRQGKLNFKIESFPVQELFNYLKEKSTSFSMKNIQLQVEPSADVVKADRVLTLFMLNTLADNAKKFTPEHGTVTIYSQSGPDYVELSVKDTGCGMSETQCTHIFDHKSIIDQDGALDQVQSHGFGLMNCKGIIEKYKKMNALFQVCSIGVESVVGKGSRFFFRLPKGVMRMVAWLALLLTAAPLQLQAADGLQDSALYVPPTVHHLDLHLSLQQKRQLQENLAVAANYSDSAYHANLTARYKDCVQFADSCRKYLNAAYLTIVPGGTDLMMRIAGLSHTPAEIVWLHQGLPLNFATILEIRNETAVAALALHDMELYAYNNKAYTQLFKEKSADRTLGEYCDKMKKSENNKWVALVVLIILLLSVFPLYYLFYFRHRLYFRFYVEKVRGINDILETHDRAQLNSILTLDTSEFPRPLADIVESIKQTISRTLENLNGQEADLKVAQAELERVEYESRRWYVSNNLLDNTLSTLKHETMYYPATIQNLLNTDNPDFGTVQQMAVYYKKLYTLLLEQAMSQLAGIHSDCTRVPLADVLPRQVEGLRPMVVLGDKSLLHELFSLLSKQNKGGKMTIRQMECKDGYVVIRMNLDHVTLADVGGQNMFAPIKENIPYMICRQIVRDNGERANQPACGIIAEPDTDGGTNFIVKLACTFNYG